jgi:uncharacterized protein YbjT (DUF2867 family)
MASRCALVVGATGLVGGHVARELANPPRSGGPSEHDRIVVLVRRPSGGAFAGTADVDEKVVDFDRLDRADFEGIDDVFACLGTTIKVAGTQEAFRKVDHDYTVKVAELAKAAGATRFALVSSVGADPGSRNFYLRTKGETERDVEAIGFPTLIVARPSVLVGTRRESRPGEKVGIAVGRAVSFAMIGGLAKYRPIEARVVARAMIAAIAAGTAGKRVLLHDELVELAAAS